MKVLLVHPADNLDAGPWVDQKWGRVIDLGLGGAQTYERWERKVGSAIVPLDRLRNGFDELHRVRDLLSLGQGRIKDRHGLNWWELTAIFFHQQMEILILLRKLVSSLGPEDEVLVTRPCFHANALKVMLGGRLHSPVNPASSHERGARHYARVFSKFPVSQLAEIFWDKYDASYAIRSRWQRRRNPSGKPMVLLPSAYVNVSRTGMAYAQTAPEADFLLVTTRSSGRIPDPPPNVTGASLASYASSASMTSRREYEDIVEEWQALRCELESMPEIALLGRLGILDAFPKLFRQGLAIRDAWSTVLDTERVTAVLCGDDSNPYTHIPLLLARNRGVATLSCHHGALDGRHLIKQNYADIVLAKGKMEEDYLIRVCGLPASRVEIGAPKRVTAARDVAKVPDSSRKPFIVLFSEAYEVGSGRAEEFYRDLLPPLADLALTTRRKLVVKLHPFESLRERWRLVKRVLSQEQQRATTVIGGPLADGLLDQTWFGITVISTVAVECAMRGIPCFLCQWLECWPYGYIQQFSKFGVSQVLQSAREIAGIQDMVERYVAKPELVRDLWQSIAPERFRELLSGDTKLDQAVAIVGK